MQGKVLTNNVATNKHVMAIPIQQAGGHDDVTAKLRPMFFCHRLHSYCPLTTSMVMKHIRLFCYFDLISKMSLNI